MTLFPKVSRGDLQQTKTAGWNSVNLRYVEIYHKFSKHGKKGITGGGKISYIHISL